MLASKQIAFGVSAKKWVNPYITNGLFSMWDGEWNAGGGLHDPLVTMCKDLVLDFDIKGSVYSENSFRGGSVGDVCFKVSQGFNVFRGDFTLEWTLNPAVELSSSLMDFRLDGYNRMYTVGGVRAGYASYQIGYLNNEGVFTLIYPMPKAGNYNGAIMFNSGKFSVFGSGKLVTTREDAAVATQGIESFIMPTTVFHCARSYNRALTAEEITHNYEIDKARFGL